MTQEQYHRWVTFSLRMARRGWPNTRRANIKKLTGFVKGFFRYGGVEIDRVTDWDGSYWHGTREEPISFGVDEPLYICDLVQDCFKEDNPFYYGDGDEDRNYYRWEESWGARISVCIRAGLDLASAPSCGVVGFCAGDIRRLYRGNVPDWLKECWEVPFDSIPDRGGVWL